jgi:hypothetical protein
MHASSTIFTQVKFFVFSIFLSSGLFFSCNQASDKNENSTGEFTAQTPSQKFWTRASSTLQKITLSDTTIVRNIQWLQPLSSLNEKIELSESQPTNGKSYTLYLDESDLNFVDIVYTTNEMNQINQVVFDIYVEDKTETNRLLEEFDAYFTVKYGKKAVEGKVNTWISKSATKIQMEDVSTSKDPGIKLAYKLIN